MNAFLRLVCVALGIACISACDSTVAPPVEQPPVDTTTKTLPVFENGMAQIVPGFNEASKWIHQELWVETEFDSDGDGRRDRMHTDVTRPLQTNTEGLKVPVVYTSSPYYAGIASAPNWIVTHELGATPPPRAATPPLTFQPIRPVISSLEVSTWVPRGFAVVHSEAPGTGLSQGCNLMGGPTEALAPKAVIDWLNGRAKGYTTIDGNDTIRATWSTGKVGMTGTSYDGTITIAAATTAVQGLEAIIPVSPLTSYYHYYRANGLVRHPFGFLGEDIDVLYDAVNSGDPAKRTFCDNFVREGMLRPNQDRITGDYSMFWAARDMLPSVRNIRAATLTSHGFSDWNVMPSHTVVVYEALKANGTPLHAYFHQAGHGGAPPLDMRVRWFTRFLYGVQNGVESGARASIVRENANRDFPTSYDDYPNPAASPVVLQLRAPGNGVGTLTASFVPGEGVETLTDDGTQFGNALASSPGSTARLLYATSALSSAVHLSGWTKVSVRMASSKAAANLSVWLVALSGPPATPTVTLITRGWADAQNAASLTGAQYYTATAPGSPLVPGQYRNLTFYLEPDDQVIAAGPRIALMIFATDRDFTIRPAGGTVLSIDLAGTSVTLPVVGGVNALNGALQ